jgi:hypothetical protein
MEINDRISKLQALESPIDLNMMLDHLASIESTTTEDELRKVYARAYAYAAGSPEWQKKIIDAKDKMKAKL